MQAISVAVGKAGIQLFAQHIVAAHIVDLLKTLPAPDRSIPVGGRWDIPCSEFETKYEVKDGTFAITLNSGSVQNLNSKCTAIEQDTNDLTTFQCTFESGAFSVKYRWTESYMRNTYSYLQGIGWAWSSVKQINNSYDYSPSFNGLTLKVKFQFKYDAGTGWEMVVQGKPTITATETSANIPTESAVLYSGNQCQFGHSASDAAVQALQNIDFNAKVGSVINGVIASIPASGDLGNGIKYDFSSGDQGLKFPAANSIQMGVKGGASYNGTVYKADKTPAVPLPVAPNDTHDLNMYVSDFEINALNWAFFEAGKLNTIVNASDLPDPNVLKVKTYVATCPALNPYIARAMQAKVEPHAAPVASFQLVYELSTAAMAALKPLLPADVYTNLTGLEGNNYISQADLEADLTAATIPSGKFGTIENKTEVTAMVVQHDINFTLLILDGQPRQPSIIFNVKRADILGGLCLGLSHDQKKQTLQFQYHNATWKATFTSSTIPKLDGSIFNGLWQFAGEPQYATLLVALGKSGVPLPIMEGFQFDFTNAELSPQDGYVSILANVLYKNQ